MGEFRRPNEENNGTEHKNQKQPQEGVQIYRRKRDVKFKREAFLGHLETIRQT